MVPTRQLSLRIVFYREADAIIAHCLEFDLLGEGTSHEEAIDSLVETIHLQLNEAAAGSQTNDLLHPASEDYVQMFAAGKPNQRLATAIGNFQREMAPLDIADVQCRDYREGD